MGTSTEPQVEVTNDRDVILRVQGRTNAAKLASAISHAIYDNRNVTLRAIGAGAVNQSVKGVAIAQGFVGPRGFVLHLMPGFTTVTMKDGEDISAIVLKVIPV
jgi:stage V sporulation protein S